MNRDNSSPERRYAQHRSSALQRGILFALTFEQWWALWEPHWDRRGKRAMDMCMCRTADKGGYQEGNVRIATNKENQHEAILEKRIAMVQKKYVPMDRATGEAAGGALDWARGRGSFDSYDAEND